MKEKEVVKQLESIELVIKFQKVVQKGRESGHRRLWPWWLRRTALRNSYDSSGSLDFS
jgi:hypothetical protein